MQFSSNQCSQLLDSYQEPSHNKTLSLLYHFFCMYQNKISLSLTKCSQMQYDIAEMFLFPEITLLNTKVCVTMEQDAAQQGTCSLYSWTVSKALPYIFHGQRLLTALESIY